MQLQDHQQITADEQRYKSPSKVYEHLVNAFVLSGQMDAENHCKALKSCFSELNLIKVVQATQAFEYLSQNWTKMSTERNLSKEYVRLVLGDLSRQIANSSRCIQDSLWEKAGEA